MNKIIYCYKNIHTGDIFVSDKNDFHEMRMYYKEHTFKVLTHELCMSKKMEKNFYQKCRIKYNAKI